MQITRTRGHVINMGQYESVRLDASVTLEVDEITEAVEGRVSAMLELLLYDDIQEATALLPAGSASHILSWGAENAA